MRFVSVYAVLYMVVAGMLRGQGVQRSEDVSVMPVDSVRPGNGGSIVFDRNLNTYNWIGRMFVDSSLTSGLLSARGMYAANIIRLESGGQRTKLQSTQVMFDALGTLPLAGGVTAKAGWSSLSYADDKSVGLNNSDAQSVLAGLGYTPLAFVDLSSMVGFRWDRQGQMTDQGLAVDIGGTVRPTNIDGYRIHGLVHYRSDNIAPRRLGDQAARVAIQKEFLPGTGDSLDAGYLRTQREFYTLADSSIESRIENAFSVANLLRYAADRAVNVSLFAGVTGRVLDKDLRPWSPNAGSSPRIGSRIDEFRLDSYLQVEWQPADDRVRASARLSYLERNEEHQATRSFTGSAAADVLFQVRDRQEQSKNNLTRRTALSGLLAFPVSPSDAVTISGWAGILRYDTPSPVNVEDRDEQLLAAMVETRHRVSRVLDAGVALDGSVSHVVYLLKERSANNNRNYVLRLAPRTTYHPWEWLTSMNAFEVLANYTVYDFELEASQVKSFSYRQFAWIDSTAVSLSRFLGLDLFAYVKVYERGELQWSEFEERPENESTDQTFAFRLRYSPTPGAIFAVGMKMFSQTRDQFEAGGRRRASSIRSIGPTCTIVWNPGPRSQVALSGWYEHRSPVDVAGGSTATFTMNILLAL